MILLGQGETGGYSTRQVIKYGLPLTHRGALHHRVRRCDVVEIRRTDVMLNHNEPYAWIDPNTTPPAGTLYKLYDTPARGAGTQGSYLIYLPPSYEAEVTRRYPVIYWLHGGLGSQTEAANIAVPSFAAAMQAGKLPETIIVIPQALPSGWYVNSKDGARPIEDVLDQGSGAAHRRDVSHHGDGQGSRH